MQVVAKTHHKEFVTMLGVYFPPFDRRIADGTLKVVQLCLTAPESSLAEMKADGRLEEFILKTCKKGCIYGNDYAQC